MDFFGSPVGVPTVGPVAEAMWGETSAQLVSELSAIEKGVESFWMDTQIYAGCW